MFSTWVGPNYFWAEIVYSLTLMLGIIESFGKLSGNISFLISWTHNYSTTKLHVIYS